LLVAENCSAERMTKMTTSSEKKALYFITEQACCLAQVQGTAGEDFLACQKAAEYLAGDDTDAIIAFDERTSAVKRDLSGLEDYDTEEPHHFFDPIALKEKYSVFRRTTGLSGYTAADRR
jgi:hypothetical protein